MPFFYRNIGLFFLIGLLRFPVLGADESVRVAASLDSVLLSGITVLCASEKHFPGTGVIPPSTTRHHIGFTRSKKKIAAVYDDNNLAMPQSESKTDSDGNKIFPAIIGRKVIFLMKRKRL
jgi:hypothetical protein